MVFKATKDNNGVVDSAINKMGRIRGVKEKSRRELKNAELISLVRKIKPHLSESIMTAATIMKNKESGAANQLKAAVILLNAYKELIGDLYDGDDEEEGVEIQPNTPIFSLRMLPTDTPEDK
jgi:hypothetical protein